MKSSIRNKKVVQIPQTYFSKATRTERGPSPKLLAFANGCYLQNLLSQNGPGAPGCRVTYPGLGFFFFDLAPSHFSNQPSGVNEETQIHTKQVSDIVQPHLTSHHSPPTSPSPIVLNLNKVLHLTGRKRSIAKQKSYYKSACDITRA